MDIPDAAFDNAVGWTPAELDALWQDVNEIYTEAAECEEHGQDENAWGSGVTKMVLRRGVKRHAILQVKNMSVSDVPVYQEARH